MNGVPLGARGLPVLGGLDSDLERACSPRRGGWTRLRVEGGALLDALVGLGPVKVEVGNRAALLSVRGELPPARVFGRHGRVAGARVDLRVDLGQWAHALAFHPHAPAAPQQLAVFDASGNRLLRVVQASVAARPAWDALVTRLAQPGLAPMVLAGPRLAPTTSPDGSVDLEGLRREWANLRDPRDLNGVLRRLGAGREQAMRLAGWLFARPTRTGGLADLLGAAARAGLAPVVNVGNPGLVQAFGGSLPKVVVTPAGLVASGRGARLRVSQAGLARAWIARFPTRQGDVHSLEVFDRQGLLLVQVLGPREAFGAEQAGWAELLAERAEAWGGGLPVG